MHFSECILIVKQRMSVLPSFLTERKQCLFSWWRCFDSRLNVLSAAVLAVQGVSVNYCHFQLNSALAIANLFIWKQCQSNKQGLEFHIWVALWMTCSMWAAWDSRNAWRHNAKFCTTQVSIPLVTCAQLSLILSFSSGRVRRALLNTLSFR